MAVITEYSPCTGLNPDLNADLWLVVHQGRMVPGSEHTYLWADIEPLSAFGVSTSMVTGYLQVKGRSRAVGVVEVDQLPAGLETVGVRQLLFEAEPWVFPQISHSLQILAARKDHGFCGRCGNPKSPKMGEWAMVCQSCGHSTYPRISPCVIVMVTRGEEVLLVRHHRHGQHSRMHTLVAGFVEPGESAEAAVHREVQEETGLSLGTVHYCFSQSWPFPHSLMLGYHAEYFSGELVLEEKELCFGGWFHRDALPDLPPGFTIARKLIEYKK
ncbi:MAG: NAD(+) diphosphatase [Endozoicomonas sp.]